MEYLYLCLEILLLKFGIIIIITISNKNFLLFGNHYISNTGRRHESIMDLLWDTCCVTFPLCLLYNFITTIKN